jgi:aryl-alcohol dehydrogenase-like predicted oxidoreductase
MKRKPLGDTSLLVTPMGLGLAALGRPGYINLGHAKDLNHNYDVEAMERHTHDVLDAAWAGGVRYFDAARSYGRAEAFLGSWLRAREIDPADVTVGSKWGYTYTADWQVTVDEGQKHEVKEHSLTVLTRQIAESRERLGAHLDLYQIHSATRQSGVMENEAVLNELARLRAGGLAVGFTVSGAKQEETIWRALEIAFDGERLFASVQATWNVLERSTTAALEAAHEAGMGVLVKEALANGRLTPRNDDPAFAEQMGVLRAQAEAHNTTVDALALAAVLNQPFVDVVLSGAARVDHLESNLAALDVAWDDATADALGGLVEPAEVYWRERDALAWN